ncbi:MAG: hypothetical protein ACRAVC_21535 [Trichormus sp.]
MDYKLEQPKGRSSINQTVRVSVTTESCQTGYPVYIRYNSADPDNGLSEALL